MASGGSGGEVLRTLIIGSGPAGLTAAIYAARAGLRPVVLGGNDVGGQLTKTSEVENFPGFAKGALGPELMQHMVEQAEHCGARIEYQRAVKIEGAAPPFRVTTELGEVLETHTIIVATGATPRFLGVKGELEYQPKQSEEAKVGGGFGVTYCAVCDGSFYKQLPVLVVGGGDSAMEEATYLAKLCQSVVVVHRRADFRASKVMVERARATPNISWELNSVVEEILGDEAAAPPAVRGVRLRNLQTNAVKEVAVKGVFVAIGHIPSTQVLRGVVTLDEDGYIVANERQETSRRGIWAAGDCHDRRYRQAVTAAGMGCKAALEVERYLTHHGVS
jgi:thioredoxin reductase (NADPH)